MFNYCAWNPILLGSHSAISGKIIIRMISSNIIKTKGTVAVGSDADRGFKELGGEIIEDEVVNIISKENKVEVKTKNVDLIADNILISSGIYSESFSKKFGVEVPIQSERGYHLELFQTNIKIKYPIMNGYLKLAITPRPTGIRFAECMKLKELKLKTQQLFQKMNKLNPF